ncbi:hypothetical protein FRB93_009357 [Tulasnella sp. JGI-2019a]|nr:hypothetical protein FRB93_009357 [Tulasnella sp. JGI-2019a]
MTSTSSTGPSSHSATALSNISITPPHRALPMFGIQAALSLVCHGPNNAPPPPPTPNDKAKQELIPLPATDLLTRPPHSLDDFRTVQIDLADAPDDLPVLVAPHSGDPFTATAFISRSPTQGLDPLAVPSTSVFSTTLHDSSSATPSTITDKVAFFNSMSRSGGAQGAATPRPHIPPNHLSRRQSAMLLEFREFEQRERTPSPDKMQLHSGEANRSVSPEKDIGLLSPPQSSELPSLSRLPNLRTVQSDSPWRFARPRPPALTSLAPRAAGYCRSPSAQQNNLSKRQFGHRHGHKDSSSSSSSYGMLIIASAVAGSPGLSSPEYCPPPGPSFSPPCPAIDSPPHISRAISPTISSSLKVRERVSSLPLASNVWNGARSPNRSPRSCYFANGNGMNSPSYGSLDVAVGASHGFSPSNSKSMLTKGKPRGLLEGLFSPTNDADAPSHDTTSKTNDAFTPRQPPRERNTCVDKENLIPAGLGISLRHRQGDDVTQTGNGAHGLKLGREECMQLGAGLRRVMQGDRECFDLLKTCVGMLFLQKILLSNIGILPRQIPFQQLGSMKGKWPKKRYSQESKNCCKDPLKILRFVHSCFVGLPRWLTQSWPRIENG